MVSIGNLQLQHCMSTIQVLMKVKIRGYLWLISEISRLRNQRPPKRALRKSPDVGVCIDRQTESKKSIEGSRRV